MFIRLTKSYVFILLSCKSSNFSEFNQIFFVFFFAKLADREMNRLWDEGIINEEVIEGWAHEHMRTPYHPKM